MSFKFNHMETITALCQCPEVKWTNDEIAALTRLMFTKSVEMRMRACGWSCRRRSEHSRLGMLRIEQETDQIGGQRFAIRATKWCVGCSSCGSERLLLCPCPAPSGVRKVNALPAY